MAHAGLQFDRVVIPAMTTVQAVAANDRYLFIASPGALGILDRRFNEWLPPFTRHAGWPALNVDAMLADPVDQDAVWILDGAAVFRYRIGFDGVVRAIVPQRALGPGSVFIDGAEPGGGLVIRSSSVPRRSPGGDTSRVNTYVRVSPTGMVQSVPAQRYDPRMVSRDANGRPIYAPQPPRYAAETPAQILDRFPAIRGFERLLTQDASLRTWPITSAASHPTASEVWFGTAGGGVFRIDPLFTSGEQLAYGLLADGASALATGADGVWIGGGGAYAGGRDGLTYVDNGLRSWRWIDGGVNSPFAGARVTSLSVFGSLLWVASTRGVILLDGQAGRVIRRWDAGSGLPSDVALAVEATPAGAWVGTTSGLVFITDDGRGSPGVRAAAVGPALAPTQRVSALARRGDTLWIASDAGVLVLAPPDAEPRRLRAAQGDSRLSARMVALVTADSLVVVATDAGDVLRISTTTGSVVDAVPMASAARIGRATAVAIDSLTIWVAGSRSVLAIERATGRERELFGARDVPGDVRAIALTPHAAWLATDAGLVRLERLADGMIR